MRPKQICCLDLNPPPLSPILSLPHSLILIRYRKTAAPAKILLDYKINAQFLKNQRTQNIFCGKTHYLYNKKREIPVYNNVVKFYDLFGDGYQRIYFLYN